jgi:cysteinyl-tRNA synthetase
LLEQFGGAFRQALDDDFNTPAAIAQLQVLRGEMNRLLETGLSKQACESAREEFRSFGRVLGLLQSSFREWEFGIVVRPDTADVVVVGEEVKLRRSKESLTDEEIERQVAERNEARRRKNFKKADDIRAELVSFGITIEDRPDGTSRWKR